MANSDGEPTGWFGYYKGRMFNQHLPSESMKPLSAFFKRQKVKTVLDFACGMGRNTVYLAGKGFDLYGFDQFSSVINETAKNLKKKRLRAQLKTLDMTKRLPYEDDFFDAVIIIRALYHAKLKTINKVAKDVVRAVKPGGYIYIESWQKFDRTTMTAKTAEKGTYVYGKGHYHMFSKSELKSLFPNCRLLSFSFKNRKFHMLAQKL